MLLSLLLFASILARERITQDPSRTLNTPRNGHWIFSSPRFDTPASNTHPWAQNHNGSPRPEQMQRKGGRGGGRLTPHARQPRRPDPLSASPPVAQRPPGAAPHPPDKRGGGWGGASPAARAASARRGGGGSGSPRGFPPPRWPPARPVPGRRGRGHGGAGPAPPPSSSQQPPPPLGSASPAAALSPGAPLGCQREAATCSGAESLLAARREGEQPPHRPRPGSYRSSRRRGKAAAAAAASRPRTGEKSPPRSAARGKSPPPARHPCSAAASRSRRGQAGWWSPPPPPLPAPPAAAARCRRPCSASCSQPSACRQVSERPPARGKGPPATAPSRLRRTWRRGGRGRRWRCPPAARCCRRGRPPSRPPFLPPSAGAPRHLPRGLCAAVRRCRSPPLAPSVSRFASVPSCPRGRRPRAAGGAGWCRLSPEGERQRAAPAVKAAELAAGDVGLAFPPGKRPRGPRGALSPGGGGCPPREGEPALGAAPVSLPRWAARPRGEPPPTSAARAACPLPAFGGRARLARGAAGSPPLWGGQGSGAGRWCPGSAVGVVPPGGKRGEKRGGKRGEASPLPASPRAGSWLGQRRSRAWVQRCVGCDCCGGSGSRG